MITVLIVDDSRLTHRYLEEVLGGQEFMVVARALDGLQAVQRYIEVAPDVVIMDILMPRMDGVAATSQIREVDPDARIVILTTIEQEPVLRAAIEAGARDYVLKPGDPKGLVDALRRAVVGRATRTRETLGLSHALVEKTAEILPELAGLNALHAMTGGPWLRRLEEAVAFHVPFTGDMSGSLSFLFEPSLGRALLEHTLPEEVDDLSLQIDALSELANIIAGRAARALESLHGRLRFEPPRPAMDLARLLGAPPICRIATEGGRLEIVLLRDDEAAAA